jgi:hypothetical protein
MINKNSQGLNVWLNLLLNGAGSPFADEAGNLKKGKNGFKPVQ